MSIRCDVCKQDTNGWHGEFILLASQPGARSDLHHVCHTCLKWMVGGGAKLCYDCNAHLAGLCGTCESKQKEKK